jgi:hypothetical protein
LIPTLNPQARGLSLVGCPRLLIQYICSYLPYLEAVSIHNFRTYHAEVTRDPLNMEFVTYTSRSIVRIVKSRRRWIGHIVRMRRTSHYTQCLKVWGEENNWKTLVNEKLLLKRT